MFFRDVVSLTLPLLAVAYSTSSLMFFFSLSGNSSGWRTMSVSEGFDLSSHERKKVGSEIKMPPMMVFNDITVPNMDFIPSSIAN
jgi:hypothetical protein